MKYETVASREKRKKNYNDMDIQAVCKHRKNKDMSSADMSVYLQHRRNKDKI